MHAQGTSGGEGPRTHVQVLANSLMASFLSLLHAYTLHVRKRALLAGSPTEHHGSLCFAWAGDLAVVGIIANYACVAADTFSSELGILANGQPRLITSLTLRKVPRGTNGGVTLLGLGAGLLGSIIIVTAAALFLPFCSNADADKFAGVAAWADGQRRTLILGLALWGLGGSILDSILGGLFQRTVRDVRSGRIVEGEGGLRVLVSTGPGGGKPVEDDDAARRDAIGKKVGDERPSRVVENGWDWLDNNDVNFLMAFIMSMGAMAVAGWYWEVSLSSIFPFPSPASTKRTW